MLSKMEYSAPVNGDAISYHIPKQFLGIRVSACLELCGFLMVALLVDALFLDGNRYVTVQPHPFWIIILLIATQYGTSEALLAALLSSVALLAWNLPEQPAGQDIYSYLLIVLKEPFMWSITAIVLGEIRVRHIRKRKALKESLAVSQARERAVSDAYTSLKQMKEKLETQMISELRTSINAYNAMQSLEALNPSRTLLGVEEIVKAVMAPEKFSVYSLGPEGLEMAICVGWKQNEPYARRFPNTSAFYKEIVGRQHMLCCINDNEAKILGTEGVIAAPLIETETGSVFGMLKIEDIGFNKLTLSNVESFRILCEVTGLAHSNAEKYRQEEINSIVNQENDLLSYTLFQQQCALFSQLANFTDLSPVVITLRLMNIRQFSTKDKALLAEKIQRVIHEKILDIVQIFNGKKLGAEFHVLLPATSNDRLKFALREIKEHLGNTTDTLLAKAIITIDSEILGARKDIIRQVSNVQ